MAVILCTFDTFGRDVIYSYVQVLRDVNHCINLFKDLDQERDLTQRVADWAVGERSKINFKGLIFNLKEFKSELEEGMDLHSHVSSQLSSFGMIDETYKLRIQNAGHSAKAKSELSKRHNIFLQNANTHYGQLSNAVAKLKNTGVFQRVDPKRDFASLAMSGLEVGTLGGIAGGAGVSGVGGAIALASAGHLAGVPGAAVLASTGSSLMATSVGATGGALALGAIATGGIAVVAGVIGCLAYYYAHPKGREKGIQYKQLKFLSDGLNTNKLLAEFQTYHSTIRGISNGIDKTLEMMNKHLEIRVTENRIIENKIIHNSHANIIRATRIYDNVKRDNLQMLLASEPNMNEATRKRIATNTAVTACKTFLKETLRYSDYDVDEFIQNLQ